MFITNATNLQNSFREPKLAQDTHTNVCIPQRTTSSIMASTTTDNRIDNVTVSNGVALPISKQGTIRVTSAKSNDINIATSLLEEMLIPGAVVPVPFASNYNNQTQNYSKAFQIQGGCTIASLQFFDALGSRVQADLDPTSGIFDVNHLFSGHKMIHINNSGHDVRWILNRPSA